MPKRLSVALSQTRARRGGTGDLGVLSWVTRGSRAATTVYGSRSMPRLMRYAASPTCPPIALTKGIPIGTDQSPLVPPAGLPQASTTCISGTRIRAVPPSPGAGTAEDEQAPAAAALEEPVSTIQQLASGFGHHRSWYAGWSGSEPDSLVSRKLRAPDLWKPWKSKLRIPTAPTGAATASSPRPEAAKKTEGHPRYSPNSRGFWSPPTP